MEAESGDEIRRLILPCREHAVDDFEPERDPLACVECIGRLYRGAFSPRATLKWSSARFQLEYDFGLDLRRVHPRNGQRCLAVSSVMHGVVVHVRPGERVELQHAPDGLVCVADLAADCRVAARASNPDELRFDGVRTDQIEFRISRGRRRDRLTVRVRRHQFSGERLGIDGPKGPGLLRRRRHADGRSARRRRGAQRECDPRCHKRQQSAAIEARGPCAEAFV